jgi:hypothetical protein
MSDQRRSCSVVIVTDPQRESERDRESPVRVEAMATDHSQVVSP